MAAQLWSVLGNSQRLDGGAMFGNAPRVLWERWAAPDDLGRIDLATRALLIGEESGRHVLCETGVGAFFAPNHRGQYGVTEDRHVLIDNLAAIGLGPADIDVIVLSHLHFDHAGGLLAGWQDGVAPSLAFPDATVVVSAAAWDRARRPHRRDRASFIEALPDLLIESGRLDVIDGPTCPMLGDGYRFHRSDGHTPGLLMVEIDDGERPLLFASDLIPGRPWVHVPITMGYDRFPEQLIDEKAALLEDLYGRSGRLFFTHDPEVAVARVDCDDSGRYLCVDEQATLGGGS